MENDPIITFVAMNISPEAGERYDKWWDAAYGPMFIKNVGARGIDRYRIVRENLDMPGNITIFHHDNLVRLRERSVNPDRRALINDQQTWPIDWYWIGVYPLIRSFRRPGIISGNTPDTIVDDAGFIYIEGYRLPPDFTEKYAAWFARSAARLYIPMLLKDTPAKCVNCFRLSEYKMPNWDNVHFLETNLPQYISIAYFETLNDFEEYRGSLEYAIFKQNLELEFSGSVMTTWNTEYRLLKTYRPQL
jgi:hypothetical protein